MESSEHKFLKAGLGDALRGFASTGLLGLEEADRGRFDYACRIDRDFSRALEAQVCWGNGAGLAKDLHHLLIGSDAPIRLLILRGNVESYRQVDEVLGDYRSNAPDKLKGFRLLALPDGFDADDSDQRNWMSTNLKRRVSRDLLFAAMFGKLRASELRRYVDHGGPFGLKCAILAHCAREPTWSLGELKNAINCQSNSSIREALIMLTSTGLLHQMPKAQPWLPTLKGRFLLDLTARTLFDATHRQAWDPELAHVYDQLDVKLPSFLDVGGHLTAVMARQSPPTGVLGELIVSALWAKQFFGVDMLDNVDPLKPVFYTKLDWSQFENLVPTHPLTEDQLLDLD